MVSTSATTSAVSRGSALLQVRNCFSNRQQHVSNDEEVPPGWYEVHQRDEHIRAQMNLGASDLAKYPLLHVFEFLREALVTSEFFSLVIDAALSYNLLTFPGTIPTPSRAMGS